MKILVIGDYHGKFPAKLKKLVKDVDLVVSIGDYPPSRFTKIFFEKCYRTDKNLWDVVGKKSFKEGYLKDWKIGEKILKYLNSVKVPVFTLVGNHDAHRVNDSQDFSVKSGWSWIDKDFFSKTIKKYPHVKRFDYRAVKIGDLVLIGAYGGNYPGKVKSKAYRKYKKKLDLLFKKYRKDNREGRVIFVTHNVPYDTKLDVIRAKDAHPIAKGKHYGSKLVRRIVNKYQPILTVGGHHHENQGRCKIGKTIAVNTGAAFEGKCVVIDFDIERGKVKSVKFVR